MEPPSESMRGECVAAGSDSRTKRTIKIKKLRGEGFDLPGTSGKRGVGQTEMGETGRSARTALERSALVVLPPRDPHRRTAERRTENQLHEQKNSRP